MEIQRQLWPALLTHVHAPEITLLIGPRQAGKTTLLRAMQAEVRDKERPVLYFNLDIQADERHFSSQEQLLQRIRLEVGERSAVIIIDEMQRREDAGRFLKGLYDQQLPYKFVVSGSGSLELKEHISESLVGRKQVFTLWPVDLMEFLHYRTQYRYRGQLAQWARLEPEQAELLLWEYLNYGGYPRVVTAATDPERRQLLHEIVESYLLRDIVGLLQLERSDAFSRLLALLAGRIGQLINYSDLARDTALATATLKRYLWYAEKTFVVEPVTPFFRNPGKELVKSPQYYFVDIGLRNFLLQLTGRIDRTTDAGFLFQNLVWQLLKQYFSDAFAPIHYWRTKDKAEVDFVVRSGNEPLPVEVKSGRLDRPAISPALRSFLRDYRPREAWVVNRTLETSVQVDGTTVRFRPWYTLLEG